jgi:hypothetical protein
MNQSQVLGIIRHALTFVGGLFITKGILDEGTATTIIGGIMTVVGAVWSIFKNK